MPTKTPLVLSTLTVVSDPLMEVHKWLEKIDFYEHNPEFDSIDLVALLPIYIDMLRNSDVRQYFSLQRLYDECSMLISMNLPDGARDYRERARVLIRAEMFNEAKADLDAAIRLDPNNREYYLTRGDLLFNIEDYQAALDDFIVAVRFDPHYNNYARRGQAYEQLGDIDAALADYEEVLKVKERHNTVRPRYNALIRKIGRTS